MASKSRYFRPSDNVSGDATWSTLVGSAVSATYVAQNLGIGNPAKPWKTTGTTATARATFGIARALTHIALFNTNIAGASAVRLKSGSGMNVLVTQLANSGGQNTPTIFDLAALGATAPQRSSTTFDIEVTTGVLGNIAIGEAALLTNAARDLRWIWGLKKKPKRYVVSHRTFGASELQYDKRIRVYEFNGKCELAADQANLELLEAEASGEVHPFVLWPDADTDTRAHFVKFAPGTFESLYKSIGSTEMPIELEEMSQGPPLFP